MSYPVNLDADYAIRFEGLSKTFGRRVQAVKNLTLEIPQRKVYGFLGPNGAGKTTTIRMLLDLIRPSAGDVYVFGQRLHSDTQILRRVGAIVEGTAFYNFMSGWKNIEVLARTADRWDERRANELFERFGVAHAKKAKVGRYSLGMKQRLGLVAVMMNDPDLIVLDEPSNGLDPSGIQEMRRFMRELVDVDGKTVFFSSHILSEVEQVCDRVAIINKGEIIREGMVADLLSEQASLVVEADPLQKAAALLAAEWRVRMDGNRLLLNAVRENVPDIVRQLTAAEIDVYGVTVQRQTLEDYYLQATTGEPRGSAVKND
jgi:ABC-2 type transport system ATP-binding protein